MRTRDFIAGCFRVAGSICELTASVLESSPHPRPPEVGDIVETMAGRHGEVVSVGPPTEIGEGWLVMVHVRNNLGDDYVLLEPWPARLSIVTRTEEEDLDVTQP